MSLILQGSTSGSITLQEPAVAGTTVLDLPAVSGTILTTTSPKAGNVIQVVSAFYSTETIVASTSFTDSGLTASITPTSSSSKILVIASSMADMVQQSNVVNLGRSRLMRGATQLTIFEMYFGAGTSSNGFLYIPAPHTMTYLDSPATTSSTTYKVQGRMDSTSNSAQLRYQINSSSSTLTLLEIAA